MLLLAVRLSGRSDLVSLLTTTVTFIILVTVWRSLFAPSDNWGSEVRRIVAFRIDSIAYGFALYLVTEMIGGFRCRAAGILSLIVSLAAVAAVNVMIAEGAQGARHLHPFASAAFGISAVLACLAFNRHAYGAEAPLRWMGEVSYAIYLFHLVALQIVQSFAGVHLTLIALTAYVLLILVAASMFFANFERPILIRRPAYRR